MSDNRDEDLIGEIGDYYDRKVRAHGATPEGVDWNGRDSQELRFRQLARLFEGREEFSLNDIGCGYGALADFLDANGRRCDYLGVDIAPAMIYEAERRDVPNTRRRFLLGKAPDRVADYSVASGIFNVRQECASERWEAYVRRTLDVLNDSARLGFAFNCLTAYSDVDKMKPYLYYGDPCFWFDLCKKQYARNVALLHDYGLYEFTILVRKEGS